MKKSISFGTNEPTVATPSMNRNTQENRMRIQRLLVFSALVFFRVRCFFGAWQAQREKLPTVEQK